MGSNNRSVSRCEGKAGWRKGQRKEAPTLEQECDLSLSFVLSSSFVSLLEKPCVEELLLEFSSLMFSVPLEIPCF